jgi:hypothetical protein
MCSAEACRLDYIASLLGTSAALAAGDPQPTAALRRRGSIAAQ